MKSLRVFGQTVFAICLLCAAAGSLAAPIDLAAQRVEAIAVGSESRVAATPSVSAGPAPLRGEAAVLRIPLPPVPWAFDGRNASRDWILDILGLARIPNRADESLDWSIGDRFVPEPSTAVLLALGLLGLAALSGRKFDAGAPSKPTSAR